MGDAGLEPATSALSRRNRVGKGGDRWARKGMIWRENLVRSVPTPDREIRGMPGELCDRSATARRTHPGLSEHHDGVRIPVAVLAKGPQLRTF